MSIFILEKYMFLRGVFSKFFYVDDTTLKYKCIPRFVDSDGKVFDNYSQY